jgi:hypothetical protein
MKAADRIATPAAVGATSPSGHDHAINRFSDNIGAPGSEGSRCSSSSAKPQAAMIWLV